MMREPRTVSDLTLKHATVLLASMPMTRTVVVPLGLLMVGLGLSGVPTQAQFRQPKAELTPVVQQQAIQPGQTVTVELGVELPEDIHVQSDNPRDPYVIPTVLTFTLPEGVTLEEITYPASTDFLLEGWEEPLAVFDHEFTIEVRLVLDADVPPGEMVLPGSLLYQACDDKVCFAPTTAAVEWRIRVETAENH
jgi:DsbC/DsbD-like thiol-disulfide interchange protein